MAKQVRKRKATSRFGNLVSNSESASEMEDAFSDNSMDDPNFDPSRNKRSKPPKMYD